MKCFFGNGKGHLPTIITDKILCLSSSQICYISLKIYNRFALTNVEQHLEGTPNHNKGNHRRVQKTIFRHSKGRKQYSVIQFQNIFDTPGQKTT